MAVKRKTFRKAHKTHHKKSKSNKVKTHKIRALRKQRKSKKGKKQKRKSKKRKNYKKGGAIPKEQLESLRNSQLSCSAKEILYNPDVDGRIIDENTPDNIVEGAMNDCKQLNPGPEQSDCEKVVLRKRKRVTKLGDLFEKLLKGEITSEAMATQLMPMVNMVYPNITSEEIINGAKEADPEDLKELADVVQDIQKIQEMTEELYEKYNFKSELYQCKLDEQPKEVVGGGEEPSPVAELSKKCEILKNKLYGEVMDDKSLALAGLAGLFFQIFWAIPIIAYSSVFIFNKATSHNNDFHRIVSSGCNFNDLLLSTTGQFKKVTKLKFKELTEKTVNKIKLLYIKSLIKKAKKEGMACKLDQPFGYKIMVPIYYKFKYYKKYYKLIDGVYVIYYDNELNKIETIFVHRRMNNHKITEHESNEAKSYNIGDIELNDKKMLKIGKNIEKILEKISVCSDLDFIYKNHLDSGFYNNINGDFLLEFKKAIESFSIDSGFIIKYLPDTESFTILKNSQ